LGPYFVIPLEHPAQAEEEAMVPSVACGAANLGRREDGIHDEASDSVGGVAILGGLAKWSIHRGLRRRCPCPSMAIDGRTGSDGRSAAFWMVHGLLCGLYLLRSNEHVKRHRGPEVEEPGKNEQSQKFYLGRNEL
jgi:hypothetical protein